MSRIASSIFATCALFFCASAHAQQAIPRFEPTPSGDRFFATAAADVPGHLTVHGGVVMDYAHQSFVLRDRRNDVVSSVVGHTLLAHAQVSLALWDRWELSASLPIALTQSGDDPRYLGQTVNSPSGGGLGDLRLGTRVRLWGERGAPLQLAISGYLWAPTGSEREFLSEGRVRVAPYLNASGRHKRLVWASQAGFELRRAQSDYFGTRSGSMVRLGAALGAVVGQSERGQLGVELNGQLVARDADSSTSGLELLAGGKWRVVRDLQLGAAVGPGLVGGIGTPTVRALLSLAYTPWLDAPAPAPAPAVEPAAEAVPVAESPAVQTPEPAPVPVAAPAPAPAPAPEPAPELAPAAAPVATPARPSVLLDQVPRFEGGSSELSPTQLTKLAAVAERMKRDPATKLTIEGHSDDTGVPAHNQRISDERAAAVRDALVKRGVANERLELVGYGADRPSVPGTSDAARAMNRRVELVLHE
jgi:outer membrane protein OmpA-like peptidoglycan-associated protein